MCEGAYGTVVATSKKGWMGIGGLLSRCLTRRVDGREIDNSGKKKGGGGVLEAQGAIQFHSHFYRDKKNKSRDRKTTHNTKVVRTLIAPPKKKQVIVCVPRGGAGRNGLGFMSWYHCFTFIIFCAATFYVFLRNQIIMLAGNQ